MIIFKCVQDFNYQSHMGGVGMVDESKEMPSAFGCEVCPELCEQAAINGINGNVCGYGWQKYAAEYAEYIARSNNVSAANGVQIDS